MSAMGGKRTFARRPSRDYCSRITGVDTKMWPFKKTVKASKSIAVSDGWRAVHVGTEGDGLKIDGLEVWSQKWRAAGSSVELPHPAYPAQVHRFDVYEIGDQHPVRFAAGELSNGVYAFYVPA